MKHSKQGILDGPFQMHSWCGVSDGADEAFHDFGCSYIFRVDFGCGIYSGWGIADAFPVWYSRWGFWDVFPVGYSRWGILGGAFTMEHSKWDIPKMNESRTIKTGNLTGCQNFAKMGCAKSWE